MDKQTYLANFPGYVKSFYGPNGIYDYSFTDEEIAAAIAERMSDKTITVPFEGDSVDRELVRDIVLRHREAAAGKD